MAVLVAVFAAFAVPIALMVSVIVTCLANWWRLTLQRCHVADFSSRTGYVRVAAGHTLPLGADFFRTAVAIRATTRNTSAVHAHFVHWALIVRCAYRRRRLAHPSRCVANSIA